MMLNRFSSNHRFWLFSVPVFFVLPSIFYWGVVTNFHFNLFFPDWLWPAYNQYFLSILDGRLDVPVEAIGPEGWVYKDKVYMYYGILPALARGLAYPFVNLETTPVSRLFVWLWSIGAVSVLQWVIIKKYLVSSRTKVQWFILIFFSFILWAGSVHLSIVQSASIYQEPYAASLFLIACYVALFSKDVLFNDSVSDLHLKSYALLAAMSVHARPNIAIFLYLMTVVLIIFDAYVRSKKEVSGPRLPLGFIKRFIKQAVFPMLILALGGLLLLLMNYIRFGNPFTLIDGLYGYYLLEGTTLKLCGFRESGQFNMLRIIPHAIYYFFGDYEAFKSISSFFSLGYVSVGIPENRLIVAWVWPVAAFVFMLIYQAKSIYASNIKNTLPAIYLSIAIFSALLMLSYGTIAYRYAADLWMPFLIALMWSYRKLLDRETIIYRLFSGYWKAPLLGVMIFLSAISPLYTMSHYQLAYFAENHRGGVYSEYRKEVYLPHKKHIEVMINPPDHALFKPCPEED